MVGTILVAVIGYGLAAVCLCLGASFFLEATKDTRPRGERIGALVCTFPALVAALVFAGITRWLLGGAL
ncbi:hypothetical protein M446_4073 [Methylobacterium sp. 4-46]|uniref:hypothetical protein n=1 Tax=unclassified Methylobacterium TaxID=2615210 RepID=UPI000165C807|nr:MULTISPECIES: hypothetical protein [Methylobacterium]ACA18431.1 hypothetical protein M446_4073 [Methylobacterium sp. 4-46]WFT77724.1 hypothetical protein QA634_20700 [Methylobacterium nodulans]